MKNLIWTVLILFCFESKAQNQCDCCNLYFLTDFRAWESYFPPSKVKKSNYSILNADYTYIDSSGNEQTNALAIFYFNRRGYVDEIKEYYAGIPNHITAFERRLNKRIQSTTMSYLDENGDVLPYLTDLCTEYSYSRNGVKTRQRSANGEFLEDSVQSYQLEKYNSNGLQIESFAQYHFENAFQPAYHSETRSELLIDESEKFAVRNAYIDDTLWTIEIISLTEFGKEKESKLTAVKTGSEVIQIKSFDYNSDGQIIHMKSLIPRTTEVFTECEDLGNFDLYFTYEKGLLQSILYSYAETKLKITFTYQ